VTGLDDSSSVSAPLGDGEALGLPRGLARGLARALTLTRTLILTLALTLTRTRTRTRTRTLTRRGAHQSAQGVEEQGCRRVRGLLQGEDARRAVAHVSVRAGEA